MARHSQHMKNNKFSHNTTPSLVTTSKPQNSRLALSSVPAPIATLDAAPSSMSTGEPANHVSHPNNHDSHPTFAFTLPTPISALPTSSEAGQWPIPGLLPAGLCLLSSKSPGSLRSLALHLALAIASDQPALNHFAPNSGQVLYLSAHEHERTFIARARHLLAESELPHTLAFATATSSWREHCVDALTHCLREFPLTRLIIIDSLSSLFPAERFWSARRKQALLNQLNHLAHEHHLCLLILHSQSRYSRQDPFNAIACSPLLLEAIEHFFVLEHPRTQPHAILHINGPLILTHHLKLHLSPDNNRWHLDNTNAASPTIPPPQPSTPNPLPSAVGPRFTRPPGTALAAATPTENHNKQNPIIRAPKGDPAAS